MNLWKLKRIKNEKVQQWMNLWKLERIKNEKVQQWMNLWKLERIKNEKVQQWINLWKLGRIKNEKVQQWIMNLDLVGRTRLRKIEIGKYLRHCLECGGDKITPEKVFFSKSIKVPRSLLSFLLLILRQCMFIG
jgi:hypothetical protein